MDTLRLIKQIRLCEYCEKDFSRTPRALNKKTIYCSDACQQQAYLKRGNLMTPQERKARSHKYVKTKFGLEPEEYEKMLSDQDNRCAICGEHETELIKKYKNFKPLSVDHDHLTKKVRGLLCNRCNIGLGNFKDDITLMARAIKYLRKDLRDVSLHDFIEFIGDLA